MAGSMGVLVVCAAPLTLLAGTIPYRIEPGPSDRFALEVEKTGLMSGKKHLFLFERYHGRIQYDPETPERSSIELVLESASIVCKDTWVKPNDLVKIQKAALEDMLAAAEHPEVVFRSAGVTRRQENTFEVSGSLTIRGRTAPATVTVLRAAEAGGLMRFRGSAVVRLKDYGLKPPSALLGAIGTKNEMRVEFEVTARPER